MQRRPGNPSLKIPPWREEAAAENQGTKQRRGGVGTAALLASDLIRRRKVELKLNNRCPGAGCKTRKLAPHDYTRTIRTQKKIRTLEDKGTRRGIAAQIQRKTEKEKGFSTGKSSRQLHGNRVHWNEKNKIARLFREEPPVGERSPVANTWTRKDVNQNRYGRGTRRG